MGAAKETRDNVDRFWKAAIKICGIGAVGAFVLWSLYKEWLHLPVFSSLSSAQTLVVFVVFLVVTLAFGMAALWAYVRVHSASRAVVPQDSGKEFPETEWKTGADLMREFGLGPRQLLQHVEGGLPAYPAKTDIYFKDAKPMEMGDVWFEGGAAEDPFLTEDLPKWLFKSSDVRRYIQESTQQESGRVRK